MCCNRVCTHLKSVIYKAKGKKPTLVYVLVLYSVAERGQKVFAQDIFYLDFAYRSVVC